MKKIRTIKLDVFQYIPDNFTGIAEYTNGNKGWILKGKLHREDGPAIERVIGIKQEYFLNGIMYSKQDYWKELYKRGKISKEELFLKLL